MHFGLNINMVPELRLEINQHLHQIFVGLRYQIAQNETLILCHRTRVITTIFLQQLCLILNNPIN